ncbi:hypothetical protein ABT297_31350 [Dactylosporangium sp. NPDC000555]|uniref:hypothetical protein n=1 Tax=Dactylosporangium sp. NPDC000555 TaxID=3154260 RepID=UPI0033319FBA
MLALPLVRWKPIAVGGADPLRPAALGRYCAIVVQSLIAYPVVLVSAILLGGLDPANDYVRLTLAVLLVCSGSVGLFSVLGYLILRFPFSPGMANGWLLLVVALGGVFGVPESVVGPLSWVSFVLPYREARAWAETGSPAHLAAALAITGALALLPLPLAKRFDTQSREQAVATNV